MEMATPITGQAGGGDDKPAPKAAALIVKWTYEEHWWGETATCAVPGVRAHVQDCDGDYSHWKVEMNGQLLAEGSAYNFEHFETAQRAAEIFMTQAVRDHAVISEHSN